jgi:serine/threonine-protein kinase
MSTGRFPIGHVLGNYRLVRTLGEGGGGTVYEGEHVALGRRMALKVLHSEIATPEIVDRFFDEARAVNQIRHPNIVDVEDLVRAETGEHYLVMELLAGEDLRSALSRERVLAPARVSRLGEQIARALAAVHRCGVIHRDLKPENIFLTRDAEGGEVAKLLDFGIAKFLHEQPGTSEGVTHGTPEYMAPEQILTSGVPDRRADIYALGMLLYECVTGAPAFRATTTEAILRGQLTAGVVPPSERRGEPVPAALEAVILRCLEKDAAHRFVDCDALADALHADVDLASGRRRAVRERTVPGRARTVPGGERRGLRMMPMFAIASLVLAVAAIALALYYLPRSEERAATTVAPPSGVPASPVVHRPPPAPATEAPPTHFQVALSSTPAAAQLFLGDVSLGVAPTIAQIPIGSAPVTIVARFSDGTEVVHTLVPDRPVAHIAFTKPGYKPIRRPRASPRSRRASRPASARRGSGRSSGAGHAAAPCRCDR